MNFQKRTWEIVEPAQNDDRASRIFDIAILALIFLNVVAVIAGSVQSVQERWGDSLFLFEAASVFVFTVEYLARLWSCTVDSRFARPIRGRIRFALRPMVVIDLLAFLPFYLPLAGLDLRTLRVLRLLRIVRLVKVGRYYRSLHLIRQVVQDKREELVLTTALMALLLIMSSTVLYYCEYEAQPEVFSSIPATMWWAVATLTTVGYGDIYPVTVLGKTFAAVISVLGIGMFALPTGILGAGFVEAIQAQRKPDTYCPHCGKEIR